MSGDIKELDEEGFDKLLNEADKLVVVEFYTTTCPVCQSMIPVYEAAAKEMGDEAIFAKVNAQRNQALAAFHEVEGVPAFKFFCKGELMREFQGEVNSTILKNTIKDLIKYMAQCKTKPKVYELDGYG